MLPQKHPSRNPIPRSNNYNFLTPSVANTIRVAIQTASSYRAVTYYNTQALLSTAPAFPLLGAPFLEPPSSLPSWSPLSSHRTDSVRPPYVHCTSIVHPSYIHRISILHPPYIHRTSSLTLHDDYTFVSPYLYRAASVLLHFKPVVLLLSSASRHPDLAIVITLPCGV